jgi:hypothetical protein
MKQDTSNTEVDNQTMDWTLWFYWIIATTSGWLIGNLLFAGIPIIIAGVLIAAMQWAVLYKRLEKAWQWFVLSSLVWITSIIVLILFLPGMEVLLGPLLGITLGVTQWTILKKHFHWSGWWIIVSFLAWTSGLTLMPGLFTSGTLPGSLTGITLVLFFRYTKKVPQDEEQNP